MTLILINAGRLPALAVNDPVIRAADMPAFQNAVALLSQLDMLHGQATAEIEQASADGHAAGFAAGHEEATARVSGEQRVWLQDAAAAAAAARAAERGDVARLAVEVVRRIAGDIGTPAVVAGLAERAAAAAMPDTAATLRVAPVALAATTARLGGRSGLTIVADDTLRDTDCVIDTLLGSAHAGLDVQLAGIERAWAAVEAGDAG